MGFSLIELMVVVVILSIITAIALPSYVDHVRRGNRTDAKSALSNAAQQMQRCFTIDNSYANCSVPTESTEGFYSLSLNSSASTYTITAKAAKSPQTGDAGCTTMTIDSFGRRTPDPDTDTNRCW